jgi:RNA polymerase sigma factor (sigma-70 family)
MAIGQLNTLLLHVRRLAGATARDEQSDEQLLSRFQADREESAFSALMQRHGKVVWNVCRRVLGHEQDAEDAFQATFLVLARKAGSIRNTEAVGSWLHGAAYRIAMRAKRDAGIRRKHEMHAPGAYASGSSDREISLREGLTIIDEEVNRLGARHRAVFIACCLEGKMMAEAARELGWKEGTVSGTLSRAKEVLRTRLARRGVTLSAALAGLTLSESATAAIPVRLIAATLQAAIRYAAGGPAPTALAAGVTRAMFVTKTKVALAILVTAGLFAAGAGVLGHQAPAGGETEKPISQKADAPAPKDATTPKTAKNSSGDKDAVTFSGRVVDPDGKPVPTAKLRLMVETLFPKPLYVQTTGGKDGTFRLSVSAEESRTYTDESTWSRACIVATGEGYGPAVNIPGELASAGDLTLRLAKDDVPIQGRILDLQGKPIPGVTVHVDGLSMPRAGDLTPWLEALEANPKDGYPIESRFLESVHLHGATPIFPASVTDAEGRFQLKGIGRERLVALSFEGPTITRTRVSVRTRPGKKIDAAMFARNPEGGRLTYYGAVFDHTAAPTRPIIGVVRDKDTGKPLAGVTIQSSKFAGNNTSGDGSVRTVTDKDGKYRLVGMAKAAGNAIKAAPATDQPYLQSVREVEDAPGLEPVTVDFDLKRGVLVKGRVLDKATEKPVFANVQYLPFADNPRYKNVPGFAVEPYLQTGEDGAFQLVALPGRGLLTARGWNDHYRMAVGAEKFLKKDRDGDKDEFLLTAPYLCPPNTVHTLVEINPDEKAVLQICDIVLDPGTMPRGTVVGPDGKPLAGTKVLGLTAYGRWGNWTRAPLKSAEFTVYGLDVNEEREVAFFHESKHLAGIVKVSGHAKGPLTVKLEPCGVVTGRLVTEDRKPQPDVLLQVAEGVLPNAQFQTDKDGRFRIEGLASGAKYTLEVVKNGKSAGRVFAGLTIKAGESKDLGDIQVKPKQ